MKQPIRSEIERFVLAYQDRHRTKTRWEQPLVRFASALDPLFHTLKSVVSPTHALPTDLLDQAASVVAFFLPFGREIGNSNREGRVASPDWALAYVETNQLIHDLSVHMKTFLEGRNYPTHVIPATHNFDPQKLVSDWSHRHTAFIAGLGRLGFNNMLVTERGCCGRVGSFITSAPAEPDPRSTEEACLFRHEGTCRRCVDRCVNDALGVDGFDRHRCYEMCLANESHFEALGKADVCGKCVVGVPCSYSNPVAAKARATRKHPTG